MRARKRMNSYGNEKEEGSNALKGTSVLVNNRHNIMFDSIKK